MAALAGIFGETYEVTHAVTAAFKWPGNCPAVFIQGFCSTSGWKLWQSLRTDAM